MIEIDKSRQGALTDLCKKYRVRKLELFGSGADERFDPDKSDLDFLVEFQDLERGEHADAYFGLFGELEALFGRRVDLVMSRSVKNPYFLENIQASRRVLYAA
jgi:predicted nucleotidyltransferase